MNKLNLIPYFDPRVRMPNKPVEVFDKNLATMIEQMYEAMYRTNGIGLAAPQVGINKQIFIVDLQEDDETQYTPELLYKTNTTKTGTYTTKLVFINPKLQVLDKKLGEKFNEGCLSVPETRADIARFANISITAQDLEGDEFSILNPTGLFAICLQHECDHLQGKLFIDHLPKLKRDKVIKDLKTYYSETKSS